MNRKPSILNRRRFIVGTAATVALASMPLTGLAQTKPIRIDEFDAEKAWWGTEADGFAARVENERAWKVGIDQIKSASYNLDQKNPHIGEQQSHNPDELLADYARLQAEAQALRDELKGILAQSLAKTAASA